LKIANHHCKANPCKPLSQDLLDSKALAKLAWIFLFYSLSSCKTPTRESELHQPYVYVAENIPNVAQLIPYATCFDEMGEIPATVTTRNLEFYVMSQRPVLDIGVCQVQLYGENDPQLRYLSSKKAGKLVLYYESPNMPAKIGTAKIDFWKLTEGKGTPSAKIEVKVSDLNATPSSARLMCKGFSSALPKTKITGNAIQFDIEGSIVSPQATFLENCTVTGEVNEKQFSSVSINQIALKWGATSTINAAVNSQSIVDQPQKSYGVNVETIHKNLPGLWTLQNAEGSCLNLEFRIQDKSLQYRFFRSELSSCKTPPANLEFKVAILHSLESEIPSQLRPKIQAENFLLQFKRIGEGSSWSIITIDGSKLTKLGNNIVDPLQLLNVTSGDTYLRN
jgi:hypothetical protein